MGFFTNDSASRQNLEEGALKLGFKIHKEQTNKLLEFLDLLQRWNAMFNLTAVEPKIWVERHLLDSLSAFVFIQKSASNSKVPGADQGIFPCLDNCLDIGSGAGLPGIPLAIMTNSQLSSSSNSDSLRDCDWYLLEKNNKKCGFLLRAKLELQLDNLHIINARIEDLSDSFINSNNISSSIKSTNTYGSRLPQSFSLSISRSSMSHDALMSYAYNLTKDQGGLITMHGKIPLYMRGDMKGEMKGKIKKDRHPNQKEAQVHAQKWRLEEITKIKVPFLNSIRHIALWLKEDKRGEREKRGIKRK